MHVKDLLVKFDVIAWTIKDIVNANCESKVLYFAHNNRFD